MEITPQLEQERPPRPPIRPPEHRAHVAVAAAVPPALTREATPPTAPTTEKNQEQGNWFHRNRWFTKEPISYTGYQFFRSGLAAVPYAFGMAFFHHAFGLLGRESAKAGLTAQGLKTLNSQGIKAVNAVPELQRALLYKPGSKAMIARNALRFSQSPVNAAAQIGLAFTMFRFTGGLVKGLRDKVMDEGNSAADTERETRHWWQTVKHTAATNWPAESTATPWAALTLGFATAVFDKPPPKYLEGPVNLKRAWGKESKLLQVAAVWTIAYSIFFETAERLFKDKQILRGEWKGHANSLTNKDDPTVGTPPELAEKKQANGEAVGKPVAPFFTEDPGLGRLLFRRVLPVAVGITGYALAKRVTYQGVGGQMRAIDESVKGASKHAARFLDNAKREGIATATFGTLWMATDAWGSWYDKFFQKMQDKSQHKALTPHQARNTQALYEQLQAKEQGKVAAR